MRAKAAYRAKIANAVGLPREASARWPSLSDLACDGHVARRPVQPMISRGICRNPSRVGSDTPTGHGWPASPRATVIYSNVLPSTNNFDVVYGTNGTREGFWGWTHHGQKNEPPARADLTSVAQRGEG